MSRHSSKAVLIALVVALATIGSAKVIRNYVSGTGLQVQLRAGLTHPTLLGGKHQTTFIKVDLSGFKIERKSDRVPVNVALVLDKSGSMSGEKIEQAIEAMILAVDHLKPGDVVSVITYDNEARVLVPATEVTDKHAIRSLIRSVTAGGGTALYAGVVYGASELKEYLSPERVNRVILLSDGQANQGPSSPSELGDLGAELIQHGISVTTIGLGLGYNEDLMTQLALRSDGNHSFVDDADDLAVIFNQEFGDVLSVVAQDLTVKIDLNEGIRPVRVLGRPAEIEGQEVTVELNQLYSEQEKYIMLEVETEPAPVDGEVEIARVFTSYANMFTQEQDELSAVVSAQITDSEQAVQEDLDKESMAAAVQQQGILNEEKAIELRDQGRVEEAEQVLRENAVYFESNAELLGDDRLYDSAEKSRVAADKLEGADWNRQRKAMRADHYRGKVQQGSK